ncbi:MAG: hypothetical protein AB7J46_06415 [Candidatus Altimarinota bacterium]
MTFNEIKTMIKGRAGLTSTDADTRVGTLINVHHSDITAALGMSASRRAKVSGSTTVGSNEVTFTGLEHIDVVAKESVTPYRILDFVPYEEIVALHPETRSSINPSLYGIKSMNADGITIAMDVNTPSVFTMKATGLALGTDLSGTLEPAYPASFHWILVERVLVDEWMRMEKADLAQISQMRADRGLSDLKMFMAKNAFLDVQQGGSVSRRDGRRRLIGLQG